MTKDNKMKYYKVLNIYNTCNVTKYLTMNLFNILLSNMSIFLYTVYCIIKPPYKK